MKAIDGYYENAFSMITSPATHEAFDLDKEIETDRNVGVGALEAAFFVSIGIIIHGIIA